MRPPKPFPPGSAERLQRLLKTATTVAEQRRIQAVLIRALDASPPERIAQVTGLSINTVRVLHSRFLREGEAFLVDRPGRGGRRRTLLDAEQEAALLQQHVQAAGEGRIIETGTLKRDYELLVGHAIAASTVYRLLAKAGWRKVVPRPRHPKKDPGAEEAFKKVRPDRRAGTRAARGEAEDPVHGRRPFRPHQRAAFLLGARAGPPKGPATSRARVPVCLRRDRAAGWRRHRDDRAQVQHRKRPADGLHGRRC